MVKNRLLLLGSVAFGVSFGLSLLVNRHIKTAFLTGLITVPATFSGVVAVNRKQKTQQKRTLTALQAQIHRLKKRETQMNQSLLASAAELERTEVDLNFLQTELNQLYIQNSEQRSEKQQLNQDLITLRETKSQMQAELHNLQTQINNVEQSKGKLHHSLRSPNTETQNAEAGFKFLSVEVEQMQVQLAKGQKQKKELEGDLSLLNKITAQLEEKSANLKNQIRKLEKQKTESNQSLSANIQKIQPREVKVNVGNSQLNQLQGKAEQQPKITENFDKKLVISEVKNHQFEANTKPSEKLPKEWNDFMMRVPKYEVEVLKALTEQVNTSAKIKKIAEINITMPELLIDFINQRALNTIGDLIIEPGNELFPPRIPEEYLTNVKKVIKIKEMS